MPLSVPFLETQEFVGGGGGAQWGIPSRPREVSCPMSAATVFLEMRQLVGLSERAARRYLPTREHHLYCFHRTTRPVHFIHYVLNKNRNLTVFNFLLFLGF